MPCEPASTVNNSVNNYPFNWIPFCPCIFPATAVLAVAKILTALFGGLIKWWQILNLRQIPSSLCVPHCHSRGPSLGESSVSKFACAQLLSYDLPLIRQVALAIGPTDASRVPAVAAAAISLSSANVNSVPNASAFTSRWLLMIGSRQYWVQLPF